MYIISVSLSRVPVYVQAELFQQPGLHNEVALIRDCLDNGSPDKLRILSNISIHHHHHHIRLIALDKMQGCLHW